MSRRQPRRPLGLLAEVVVPAAEHLDWGSELLVGQIVGILLAPLEASLGTVDPDAEVVFLSGGDLRGDHDALGAALVADQEVAVVVETSALDEGSQVGADLGHLESGYRAGKAFGVGDRKSTRLNSSHANISYAVFCLKKTQRNPPLTYVPP